MRAIIAQVRQRRRRGARRADAPLRPARSGQHRHPRERGRDRGGRGGLRQGDSWRRWSSRATASRPITPPDADRRPLHRCARRGARLALDGGRIGRPLRAGRARQLSELGADERRAGQGRRRAAHRHGRALARRRDQSAGAGRRAAGRRRRDLSHRRRAGRGGAGLRHRDDRAGRQDRRAGQRLCRRRQAPGVRHGRHRFDRRPLRGAGDRRPATTIPTGSPPTCWRRPSTTPPPSPS